MVLLLLMIMIMTVRLLVLLLSLPQLFSKVLVMLILMLHLPAALFSSLWFNFVLCMQVSLCLLGFAEDDHMQHHGCCQG